MANHTIMFQIFQGIFMLISLSIAQEQRVRLRRPRPIDEITNPDGNEEGQPIPLRRIPQGKFLFN